ncbi:MAG: hypothetical protein MUC31_05370, partial [Bacteroidales bacterium]|nr:hypothetical protein [Bacteroidales bacterium]
MNLQDNAFVVECPTCFQKYRYVKQDIMPATEGRLWSDGFGRNDLLPAIPLMVSCEICSGFFRISPEGDHQLSAKPGPVAKTADITQAGNDEIPSVRRLTAEEFAEVLAKKKYMNPEEERGLRMQLWWSINNYRRN